MLFIDYCFEVGPNGTMALDKELSLEKLKWNEGDQFEVQLINGRIFLKKIKEAVTAVNQAQLPPIPVY
jgi:hypothetical protein